MNPFLYATLALDLASDRRRQAEAQFAFHRDMPAAGPGFVRHGLAASAALVSRASASIARRLDERTVESDLSDCAPA